MKKLVIAAVAMMAAVCAKAAACDWAVGFEDSPAAAAAEGWVGYFVDGTKYESFSALDTAGKLAFLAVAENVLDTQTSYEGRGGMEFFGNGGSWAAGATASGFAVIFDAASIADADYYAVTAVATDKIGDGGADGYLDLGYVETSNWVATATPEPTSGLLLLIGMAGLALRRRRA